MYLGDVGIDENRIDEMVERVAENKGLEETGVPLLDKDIAEVFRESV